MYSIEVFQMVWSTISPVQRAKAASGATSVMAAYMLSAKLTGESQLCSPFGPAGESLTPGSSSSVYGLIS